MPKNNNRKVTLPKSLRTLNEVAGGSGTETSGENTGAFGLDDILKGAEHALVVLDGVKLDARLDDVDGAHRTVGDGAADTTGEGGADEVIHPVLVIVRHVSLFGENGGKEKK